MEHVAPVIFASEEGRIHPITMPSRVMTSFRDNACPQQVPTGFAHHGTHAEYVAVNAASVVLIPAHLASTQAAPMLCAGVTSYRAVKHCGAYAGQWLAIFGAAGGLGLMAIQFAHYFGLKVRFCNFFYGFSLLLWQNCSLFFNFDDLGVRCHLGPRGLD